MPNTGATVHLTASCVRVVFKQCVVLVANDKKFEGHHCTGSDEYTIFVLVPKNFKCTIFSANYGSATQQKFMEDFHRGRHLDLTATATVEVGILFAQSVSVSS